MKKIVIACDSFKESMSAIEACHAIEKGIKTVDPYVNCLCIPMADGGEGTTAVLMNALNAKFCSVVVKNPFLSDIEAFYGVNDEGVALMEVASTCGIDLIPREKRNPTKALSFGLGQMIQDALNKGVHKIIVGLGGSGTNDGGYGMLYALGAKFYDYENNELPLLVDSIQKIESMDLSQVFDKFKHCEIIVASDVDNVLTGQAGATYVFGKQKGSNDKQLAFLEESLVHFKNVIHEQFQIDLNQVKKTGAAGGLGGAFYLLGAKMTSGIDLVLDVTEFKKHIQDASYIMSGEGSIDSQTINGKTISGIAKLASQYQVPVIVFGGRVSENAKNLYDIGVTAMFSITNEAKTLQQALLDGKHTLETTASNVYRLIQ